MTRVTVTCCGANFSFFNIVIRAGFRGLKCVATPRRQIMGVSSSGNETVDFGANYLIFFFFFHLRLKYLKIGRREKETISLLKIRSGILLLLLAGKIVKPGLLVNLDEI